jgi:hypothetical protein
METEIYKTAEIVANKQGICDPADISDEDVERVRKLAVAVYNLDHKRIPNSLIREGLCAAVEEAMIGLSQDQDVWIKEVSP